MKVRLTVSRAGGRVSHSAGEVIEVGEKEGSRLIDAGQAEPVSFKETATKKSRPQKAIKE